MSEEKSDHPSLPGLRTHEGTTVKKILSRARRIIAAVGVSALMTFGVTALTASPAAASATGCAWGGGINAGGYYVPATQYCFGIQGSGTNVTGTSGSYNSPWGNVCNWRETLVFKNANNVTYKVVDGPTHWGCWHANYEGTIWRGTAQRGKIIGQLKSNGVVIAQVGHAIY